MLFSGLSHHVFRSIDVVDYSETAAFACESTVQHIARLVRGTAVFKLEGLNQSEIRFKFGRAA